MVSLITDYDIVLHQNAFYQSLCYSITAEWPLSKLVLEWPLSKLVLQVDIVMDFMKAYVTV